MRRLGLLLILVACKYTPPTATDEPPREAGIDSALVGDAPVDTPADGPPTPVCVDGPCIAAGGNCMAGVCVIACGEDECASLVTCPDNMPCDVRCIGAPNDGDEGPCGGGVACGNATSCEVTCERA